MTDTSNKQAFGRGSTVFVKPGVKNILNDHSTYSGKTVEVVYYDDEDDGTAYRAEQRAKVLAFFAGDEATLNTNYAGLDDNRLMIDGVYDIDALVKLLREI